jgi:hypothetical protein
MAKSGNLGDYQAILSRMEQTVDATVTLPEPFKGATSLEPFKTAIDDARRLLPLRYQAPYVDILDQVVKQAEKALASQNPQNTAKRQAVLQQLELVFSALAAPIAQLRSTKYEKELKAFLAVISDVYKHFVDSRKIRGAAKSKLLWPNLDPLGAFSADSKSGPFTLAATAELPVALVNKPACHTAFLPMWLIDGHEVGGHSIFTAVDGFEKELETTLESKLRAAFAGGTVKISDSVTFNTATGAVFASKRIVGMQNFMVRLWKQWLPELAADAAGLLNMGPMFANGLTLCLAIERPDWELTSKSVFDFRRGFTDHPMDVVRALLMIEMTKKLGIPQAAAYAKALMERLLDVLEGPLPEKFVWVNRVGSTAVELKLTDLQAILPVVADAIMNSSLKALSGESLLSVMPWTKTDEKAVRSAAALLLRGRTDLPDSVAARHVVAGSMLAVERATLHLEFVEACKRIHDAGIAMLTELYSGQCLLCNVQTLRTTAAVQLKDLVKLVKSMRGR